MTRHNGDEALKRETRFVSDLCRSLATVIIPWFRVMGFAAPRFSFLSFPRNREFFSFCGIDDTCDDTFLLFLSFPSLEKTLLSFRGFLSRVRRWLRIAEKKRDSDWFVNEFTNSSTRINTRFIPFPRGENFFSLSLSPLFFEEILSILYSPLPLSSFSSSTRSCRQFRTGISAP